MTAILLLRADDRFQSFHTARVNRFGSTRPRCTRNVRFYSDSVQTLEAQRNDALCQGQSFDDSVGVGEQHRRGRKAEGLRSLEIDDQLELGRLHN